MLLCLGDTGSPVTILKARKGTAIYYRHAFLTLKRSFSMNSPICYMHEAATRRISVVLLAPRLTAGSAGPLSPTIADCRAALTSFPAAHPPGCPSPTGRSATSTLQNTSTSPHLSPQRALAVPFNCSTPPGCGQSSACPGTASLGRRGSPPVSCGLLTHHSNSS